MHWEAIVNHGDAVLVDELADSDISYSAGWNMCQASAKELNMVSDCAVLFDKRASVL